MGGSRTSFVPPRPQRELRDLTRYRRSLVADRARLESSIQKVVEDTNIKLASVVTDITGKSGRAILRAFLDGEQDPQKLAELALGRMREKREQLAQAVQGTLEEHHRFLLESRASTVGLLRPTGSGGRSRDCSSSGSAKRPRYS